MQSKIIGLTGSIGSGKSTASKILNELGLPIVDADKISNQVLEDSEVLKLIKKEFGENSVKENGKYNRDYMRDLVTKKPEELKKLNKLLHPIIKEKVQEAFDKLKENKLIIYDCPLLIESGENERVDHILLIEADKDTKINRIVNRDQLSKEQAEDMLNIQLSPAEKISKADTIIFNDSTEEDLKLCLENFINSIN